MFKVPQSFCRPQFSPPKIKFTLGCAHPQVPLTLPRRPRPTLQPLPSFLSSHADSGKGSHSHSRHILISFSVTQHNLDSAAFLSENNPGFNPTWICQPSFLFLFRNLFSVFLPLVKSFGSVLFTPSLIPLCTDATPADQHQLPQGLPDPD